MVMSCAEELGAGLHDGAGEATALLEQGEARFGHVWCRGLLASGSHFLLFDRSYGRGIGICLVPRAQAHRFFLERLLGLRC